MLAVTAPADTGARAVHVRAAILTAIVAVVDVLRCGVAVALTALAERLPAAVLLWLLRTSYGLRGMVPGLPAL